VARKYVDNLHRLKKKIIEWAMIKKQRDKEALKQIELELELLEQLGGRGYKSAKSKLHIV